MMKRTIDVSVFSMSLLLASSLGGCSNAALPVVVESGASSGTMGGGSADAGAPSFFLGADITWVQADEAGGATYSDGTPKEILALLRGHGFNYVRMRTFVDPTAADGYDKVNG